MLIHRFEDITVHTWCRLPTKKPANRSAEFKVVIESKRRLRRVRPTVSLPESGHRLEVDRMIVSPDYSTTYFSLKPSTFNPSAVYPFPGNCIAEFPLQDSSVSRIARVKIPFVVYKYGTLSVGRDVLPSDRQQGIFLSGTSFQSGDYIAVSSDRTLSLTSKSSDCVPRPIGHVYILYIVMEANRGGVIDEVRTGDGNTNRQSSRTDQVFLRQSKSSCFIKYAPYSSDGVMTEGLNRTFFDVSWRNARGNRMKSLLILNVLVEHDGTSRVVYSNLPNKQDAPAKDLGWISIPSIEVGIRSHP